MCPFMETQHTDHCYYQPILLKFGKKFAVGVAES